VQGKLIFHLSINLTTSATSSRPNDPSLALTPLPSNDCSPSVKNYSVNNYSINNCSINNCSIDDYSINNAPANTASINSASVSELYAQSISLSSRTTSPEVTTPIMAIPTTIIPGTDSNIVANSSTDPETSSLTRRKNALARALFGASDSDESLTSPSPLPTDEPDGTSNSTRREDVSAQALFGASDSDEHPPPTRSRMRGGHRDARVDPPRPSSPAWSFRSRSGSATSHDGGLFSGKLRFGSRRSAKTSNASSASAIEVPNQRQALTSSSSLPTDEPKETSSATSRKNAFTQALSGASDSDELHHDDPPPIRSRMRDGHRDARVDPPRQSSPARSFRSRSGSATSYDSGLFSGKLRSGSRRSAKTSNATSASAIEVHGQHQSLISPSSLSTDEPNETSSVRDRKNALARMLFGASDSDESHCDDPPPTCSRMRDGQLDARADPPRPSSPAWSFRSRSGSTTSYDGGLSSGKPRFGSRRSAKTSSATLASAMEVHSQHQSLISPSSLPTDEPDETSSARRRKNALARAIFGASDSDESLTSSSPLPTDVPNETSSATRRENASASDSDESHHDDPPPTRSRMRDGRLDARADPPRPSSRAWSFHSRSGSVSSHDGGLFSGKLRFGSRRSAKTSSATSASAMEVHGQHQSLISPSSLLTDDPNETSSTRDRKNALARALFGASDSDESHCDDPPPTRSRTRDKQLDARADPSRSSSPAWSFCSCSGSTTSYASAIEMHGQHQSLISPSSLPTDEPNETSNARDRKNALARAISGASELDESLTSPSPLPTDVPNETSSATRRENASASDSDESHDDQPPTRPRMRDGQLGARADPPQPSSPAWSFRSRSGSATSHDGGLFSGKLRFGSRRSAKTSNATSASAIEVHSQRQSLISPSPLPADEPNETSSARRRKNALVRAIFGAS